MAERAKNPWDDTVINVDPAGVARGGRSTALVPVGAQLASAAKPSLMRTVLSRTTLPLIAGERAYTMLTAPSDDPAEVAQRFGGSLAGVNRLVGAEGLTPEALQRSNRAQTALQVAGGLDRVMFGLPSLAWRSARAGVAGAMETPPPPQTAGGQLAQLLGLDRTTRAVAAAGEEALNVLSGRLPLDDTPDGGGGAAPVAALPPLAPNGAEIVPDEGVPPLGVTATNVPGVFTRMGENGVPEFFNMPDGASVGGTVLSSPSSAPVAPSLAASPTYSQVIHSDGTVTYSRNMPQSRTSGDEVVAQYENRQRQDRARWELNRVAANLSSPLRGERRAARDLMRTIGPSLLSAAYGNIPALSDATASDLAADRASRESEAARAGTMELERMKDTGSTNRERIRAAGAVEAARLRTPAQGRSRVVNIPGQGLTDPGETFIEKPDGTRIPYNMYRQQAVAAWTARYPEREPTPADIEAIVAEMLNLENNM